jgi:beta-phosphoglucomutase-like phosphatase (HAD superfamily)
MSLWEFWQMAGPDVVFWDCDGVLAINSEALAMPIAGILLNEAMRRLHPEAPQFDIKNFTAKYAGGHFSQFYALAVEMLKDFDASLLLPAHDELDAEKVRRTVEVLTEQAMPAADMAATLEMLRNANLRQCVVSSSEFNRVIPCVEKIVGQDFGGAYKARPLNESKNNIPDSALTLDQGRVFSAADTMLTAYGERRVKPMPDIAYYAAKAMGLSDLSRGVAIEDSTSGIECWVRAGIPVIGYTGATHILDKDAHAEKLMALGAMAVYPTVSDIGRHIIAMRQPAAVPSGTGLTSKARPS